MSSARAESPAVSHWRRNPRAQRADGIRSHLREYIESPVTVPGEHQSSVLVPSTALPSGSTATPARQNIQDLTVFCRWKCVPLATRRGLAQSFPWCTIPSAHSHGANARQSLYETGMTSEPEHEDGGYGGDAVLCYRPARQNTKELMACRRWKSTNQGPSEATQRHRTSSLPRPIHTFVLQQGRWPSRGTSARLYLNDSDQ
jgi:hypothetical protein